MGCGAWLTAGDQQLLTVAPAYALHRLRKAELIRLWKVAGMWNEEDMGGRGEEEEGGDLGKKELVDGLIAAVSPDARTCVLMTSVRRLRVSASFRQTLPLAPRPGAKRRSTLPST